MEYRCNALKYPTGEECGKSADFVVVVDDESTYFCKSCYREGYREACRILNIPFTPGKRIKAIEQTWEELTYENILKSMADNIKEEIDDMIIDDITTIIKGA